jgi:hypothetical protein
MVGQFIDTFWRKSFIGDLQRAKKVSEDDNQWSLMYDGKSHLFQFVWIQGICVKVGSQKQSAKRRRYGSNNTIIPYFIFVSIG